MPEFLSDVKKLIPGIITVVGGVHPTLEYRSLLQNHKEVDIAVLGEGPYTMHELLESLKNGNSDLKDIKGLAYRENGEVKKTFNSLFNDEE